MATCKYCGEEDICIWDQYEDKVLEQVNAEQGMKMVDNHVDVDHSNRAPRKLAYWLFVIFCYRYLGAGERVRLPKCVRCGIRRHFPDLDGDYMGHMAS